MARLYVQPTHADRWIAGRVAISASPAMERPARVLTVAADERPLLAAVAVYWLVTRVGTQGRDHKLANHLAANVLVSAVLPHVLKRLFAQERPDRLVIHSSRNGIPVSGKPMDAFPSGHAVHMGAAAAAFSRFFPRAAPLFWTAGGLLAATRVVLLAHWLTDVLVGLGLGIAVENILWRFRLALSRRSRELKPLKSNTPARGKKQRGW